MSHVEVTINVKDANGKDGYASVRNTIHGGDMIPEVIKKAAEEASNQAWESVMPREKPLVEWSTVASAQYANSWYNAFQRNSYIARVTFVNGEVVVVVLPQNAAQWKTAAWETVVEDAASKARLRKMSTTLIADGVTP